MAGLTGTAAINAGYGTAGNAVQPTEANNYLGYGTLAAFQMAQEADPNISSSQWYNFQSANGGLTPEQMQAQYTANSQAASQAAIANQQAQAAGQPAPYSYIPNNSNQVVPGFNYGSLTPQNPGAASSSSSSGLGMNNLNPLISLLTGAQPNALSSQALQYSPTYGNWFNGQGQGQTFFGQGNPQSINGQPNSFAWGMPSVNAPALSNSTASTGGTASSSNASLMSLLTSLLGTGGAISSQPAVGFGPTSYQSSPTVNQPAVSQQSSLPVLPPTTPAGGWNASNGGMYNNFTGTYAAPGTSGNTLLPNQTSGYQGA